MRGIAVTFLCTMGVSFAVLGLVSALTIDNQLTVIKNDCYERLAIGQRLHPRDVYKTEELNTVPDCQQFCTKDEDKCKSFSFGIGPEGNATCELSFHAIRETIDLKPIGTISDTDYDLYIKKLGCKLVIEQTQAPPVIVVQSESSSNKPDSNSIGYNTQEYAKPPTVGYKPSKPLETRPLYEDKQSYASGSGYYENNRPPRPIGGRPTHSGGSDEIHQVQTLISIRPSIGLRPVGQGGNNGYGDRIDERPAAYGPRPDGYFGRPDNEASGYGSRPMGNRPSGGYGQGFDSRPVDSGYGSRPDDRPMSGYGSKPDDRPMSGYGSRPDDRPSNNGYDSRPHDRPLNDYGSRPDDDRPVNDYGSRPDNRPVNGYGHRPDNRPSNGYDSRPMNDYGPRPDDRPSNGYDSRPDNRPTIDYDPRPHNRPSGYDSRPDNSPMNGYDSRPDRPERPNGYNSRPDDRPDPSGYDNTRPPAFLPSPGSNDGYNSIQSNDRPESYDSRPDPNRPGPDRPPNHGYKPDNRPMGYDNGPLPDSRPMGYDDRPLPDNRPMGYDDRPIRPPIDEDNYRPMRPRPEKPSYYDTDRYDVVERPGGPPIDRPYGSEIPKPLRPYDSGYNSLYNTRPQSFDSDSTNGYGGNKPYGSGYSNYEASRPDFDRPPRPIARPQDSGYDRPGPESSVSYGTPNSYGSYPAFNRPVRPSYDEERPLRPYDNLPPFRPSSLNHPYESTRPNGNNYFRPSQHSYDPGPVGGNPSDINSSSYYGDKNQSEKPTYSALMKPESDVTPYYGNSIDNNRPKKGDSDDGTKGSKQSHNKPVVSYNIGANGERITSIITEIDDSKACFRRGLAGKRVIRSFVRRALPCERVEECQRECAEEKRFVCEGFNYRLDPAGRGNGDCELLDLPLVRVDLRHDVLPDPDFDYYERNRNSAPDCEARYHELRGEPPVRPPQPIRPLPPVRSPIPPPPLRRVDHYDSHHRYPPPGRLPSDRDYLPHRPVVDGNRRRYEEHRDYLGDRDGDRRPSSYGDTRRYYFDDKRGDDHYSYHHHQLPSSHHTHHHSTTHHQPPKHSAYLPSTTYYQRPSTIPHDNYGPKGPPRHSDRQKDRNHWGAPPSWGSYGGTYGTFGGPETYYGDGTSRNQVQTIVVDLTRRYDYLPGNSITGGESWGKYGGSYGTGGNVGDDGGYGSVPSNNGESSWRPLGHNELLPPFVGNKHKHMDGYPLQYEGFGYGSGHVNKVNQILENTFPVVPEGSIEHKNNGRTGGYNFLKDECSLRTATGFRLHKALVKKYVAVPSIYECESLCFSIKEFNCLSYAFRYTVTLSTPSDNCYLSEKSYKQLEFYTDLEPDRDFDIYTMNNQKKCEQPMGKVLDNSDCFWHTRSGQRLGTPVVRDTLNVNSIVECQIECLRSVKFTCRAFSFRYGSPIIGGSVDNCQLTDWPFLEINPKTQLESEPGFEVYERGSFGHGCEPNHFQMRLKMDNTVGGKTDQLCYVGYGTPARLAPPAIRKSVFVNTEFECKAECTKLRQGTLFQCMSFSYRTLQPHTEPNCDLSDILQRDLLAGVDYRQDDEAWLFAWDNYNPDCLGLSQGQHNTIEEHLGRDDQLTIIDRQGYDPIYALDTWRVFSVSGWPCRRGSLCKENREAGFWFCELEGGDLNQWDYCCRPDHQCGYSEGFNYQWCYVGPEFTQWRKCSDRYYPYIPKIENRPPHNLLDHHKSPPPPAPASPFHYPSYGPLDDEPIFITSGDSFRPNRPPAMHPPPTRGPSLNEYEQAFHSQFLDPPKPGGFQQQPRFWPVSYLHHSMPPLNGTDEFRPRFDPSDKQGKMSKMTDASSIKQGKVTALENLIAVIKAHEEKDIQFDIASKDGTGAQNEILYVKIPLPSNITKNGRLNVKGGDTDKDKDSAISGSSTEATIATTSEESTTKRGVTIRSKAKDSRGNRDARLLIDLESAAAVVSTNLKVPVFRKGFVEKTNLTNYGRPSG